MSISRYSGSRGAVIRNLALAILLAGTPACASAGTEPEPLVLLEILTTAGARHQFSVEIADTDRSRSRGLMFRNELPADQGMLLFYDYPRPVSIWMKNTYLPLDILFINDRGRVARIVERATPLSLEPMSSGTKARAVLEINGGRSAELGIRVGDRVIVPPVWME